MGNDIFAIWGRFLLIFALDMLNIHHISTYWPRKCVVCSSPTMKISTKFEVDMTFHCLVIAFVLLICYLTCDLDLWPFDPGQWSYMAGQVINSCTKFEDPISIRPWVMSYDISCSIPLTMPLQPLCMRRIMWSMPPPEPYYGPTGTTRVSRCQKKASSGLYGAGEDNKRQTHRQSGWTPLHPDQSAIHLHHSPQFSAGYPSCRNPSNLSWLEKAQEYAGLHTSVASDLCIGRNFLPHIWNP